MDWVLAAGHWHEKLLIVIVQLFALARIEPGERPELDREARCNTDMTTLPRYVFKAVMMILEPAEASLRRLLIIVAHGHGWHLKPPVTRGAPAHFIARRDFKGLPGWSKDGFNGLGLNGRALAAPDSKAAKGAAAFPAFNMFDPLPSYKNCVHFYEAGEDKPVPPRPFPAEIPEGSRFTPISAVSLWRRINSLHFAAQNLETTAKRYARWKARQDHCLAGNPHFHPKRSGAMKPGRPPGWRRKWQHEVDEILRETHFFANDALYPTGNRKKLMDWSAADPPGG